MKDRPKVPFLDVGAASRELREDIVAAFRRVLDSGWYLLGPELEAFEEAFARYCGAKNCVGVASGLDALHLILEGLGIGEGDEVIVPANTFIATWLAVSRTGAVPVPVEPDARSFNLDPARIEEAVTPATRAVMPVHVYGQPADMDGVREAAERHGLVVIEDAAQAHGARYRGKRAGSLGEAAAFSFYPAKNLGALGDGGAVVTDDGALAGKVRALRNYGSVSKYVHETRGYNARLDEFQAAFLRLKLESLDAWNERRKEAARTYLAGLAGARVILPVVPKWADPVWHLFVVRSNDRDALKAHLASKGVETLIHYPVPPHLQKAYADLGHGPGSFPITEALHREVLSLPMGPHLTRDDQEGVVDAVRSF